VRVRGLKSRRAKQKVFHWLLGFLANPFKYFLSGKKKDDEEEDDDDIDDQSTKKKMSKYKKVKQRDLDHEDEDEENSEDDDSVVIIEAEKMKRQQQREIRREKKLKKKRQEAICGDISNFDQFEVGVLLLGMEKGNVDVDDEELKGKVLPVSTLRSPYFDGEANLDDVMFARHVRNQFVVASCCCTM
jgi:hypothetical protein